MLLKASRTAEIPSLGNEAARKLLCKQDQSSLTAICYRIMENKFISRYS